MKRSRLFLLLAAFPVAAVLGGIALGQWLALKAPVDQAAVASAQKGPVDISRLPLADGNGVPEPPQPLPDGSRGVPPKVLQTARAIPTVSASVADAPPQGVMVSTRRPGASAMAAASPSPWADGTLPAQRVGVANDVVPVSTMDDSGFIPAESPGMAVAAAPAGQPPRAQPVASRAPSSPDMPAWQRVLRIQLERCESQGPAGAACAQEARENYCESNGGWGQVSDCRR